MAIGKMASQLKQDFFMTTAPSLAFQATEDRSLEGGGWGGLSLRHRSLLFKVCECPL
jgi:hypothetical protein